MMLLIINSVIVLGLMWVVGVLIADAFSNRRKTRNAAIHYARLPRWARSNS